MTARRDALLFLAAALVPSAAMGFLGWRALQNEEASLRREAILEVSREADKIASATRARLEEGAAALEAWPRGLVTSDAAAQLEAYERARKAAPPFAEPIVVSERGTLLLPRDETASDAAHAKTCEDAVAALASGDRPTAKKTILASCEDARDARGRWLWPVLAVEDLTRGSDPALRTRIAGWLERRASDMRPEERAVTQQELTAITLSDDLRKRVDEALRATSPTSSASAPVIARAIKADSFLGAIRAVDTSSPRVVRFAGSGIAGALVAADDGGFVGFIATPESLARGLRARPPSWFTPNAELAAVATTTPAESDGVSAPPVSVAWITDGLGVKVELADPTRISKRAARSERILAALIAAGIALALGLAALLYRRMRATRRTSELRTSFVAGVSHELRTPLASVRMLSELLEENRVEEEERAEVAAALAKEARRMGDTVERFMSYAKSERGKLIAAKTPVDLAEVALARVAAFVERHPGVRVETTAPDALETDADRPQIEIVVDNLLENALKYAPAGQPYEVVLARSDHDVTLSVRDRGPGIAARHRRRIFDAFERGDDRLSKATSGTGLGLFLVRAIARAHGGDATVESDPGEGARFVVTLPSERT